MDVTVRSSTEEEEKTPGREKNLSITLSPHPHRQIRIYLPTKKKVKKKFEYRKKELHPVVKEMRLLCVCVIDSGRGEVLRS